MNIAEKLVTIAENEKKVYEKGRLDAWNKITNNNKRQFYTYAYRGMPDGSFDPPFAVKPRNAEGMFYGSGIKKITTEQLDTSLCTNFPFAFSNSAIEELGVIDLQNNTNNASVFSTGSLHTIEKLILSNNGSNLSSALSQTTGLINIKIEGKIGANFNIGSSANLSYESLMGEKGIINALKDYSGTGETRTITLHADVKAMLTESDMATARQKGWDIV